MFLHIHPFVLTRGICKSEHAQFCLLLAEQVLVWSSLHEAHFICGASRRLRFPGTYTSAMCLHASL